MPPAPLIPHLTPQPAEAPDALARHFALAQLGLLSPNPRRGAGPQQLAVQPALSPWTQTTTLPSGKRLPATVLAGSTYLPNPNAPYRFFGSSWSVPAQNAPDNLFLFPLAVSGQFEQGYGFVDAETDAPTLEVVIKGSTLSGRLFVDQFDGQGLRQVSNATAWAATTAYPLGAQVRPTTNNPDAHIFQCTTAGSSGGSQPNWNTAAGSPNLSLTDGTVTWQNVSAEPPLALPPPADGNIYVLPVAFGSRRFRRIVWESANKFAGFRIGRTDTIRKSAVAIGPRVVVIGDSFAEGSGGSVGFIMRLAHARGWLDTFVSGVGSTGYLNNGSPTYSSRYTFRGRLQDVTSYAPDLVIVTGGLNDSAYTAAQLQAEAALYFQAIKAGPPGQTTGQPPILIVCGPFAANGAPGAAQIAVRDGIRAAATQGLPNTNDPRQAIPAVVDCYIETLFGPYPYAGATASYLNDGTDTTQNPQLWWSGASGKVSAPAGLGNVDFLVAADGTHPSELGHQMIAARIDAGIEQWRAASCPPGYVATP